MLVADIFAALEATWPPVSRQPIGNIVIREGDGGGKRAASAYAVADHLDPADISRAALFQLREDQTGVDLILAQNGFAIVDPTLLYAVPIDPAFRFDIPPVTAFEIWPPLQVMRDIWQAGGIGPQRVRVMARALGLKTGLFGRINDHVGGAGFIAIHEGIAMLHALEVLAGSRKCGLGRYMSQAGYNWAADNGASTFALAVTEANHPARQLYASLGMSVVARYHYRMKNEVSDDQK